MEQFFLGTKNVSLSKKIGKGGEGEVFLIKEDPSLAVKIYYKNIRSKRKNKVLALVSSKYCEKTEFVAFPREVLTNSNGESVGFSMKVVSEHYPMHELYSPKSRKTHYPNVDYRFIVRAACNVARAVASVHQQGCIIGDFNHSGALISKNATVALIDADSFQFAFSGQQYLCEVGIPEFTPPELQGVSLRGRSREESSDLFGLAVAIFQLLFMGRHPYAGVGGPESLEDAISKNCFAYSLIRQRDTMTLPPPGMFTLKSFPLEVLNAFERAFGVTPRNRTTAQSWVDILVNLESSLVKCKVTPSHFYPRASGECLWCNFAAKFRLDMFPNQVTLSSSGLQWLDNEIATVFKKIKQVEISGVEGIVPEVQSSLPIPISQPLSEEKSDNSVSVLIGIILIVGGLFWVAESPNPAVLLVFWIAYFCLKASDKPNSTTNILAVKESYSKADLRVQKELDRFIRKSTYGELQAVAKSLSRTVAQCMQVDDELQVQLDRLKVNNKNKQLNTYLDRFSIHSAKISGIGPSKKAKLRSFGIETAADISNSKVRAVPGFGEVYTSKLVDWRKQKEVGFTYKKDQAADIQEKKKIKDDNDRKKHTYLNELKSGLKALESYNRVTLIKEAKSDVSLVQAISDRFAEEHKLKSLGISIPRPKSHSIRNIIVEFPVKKQKSSPANQVIPSCPNCGSIMVRRIQRKAGRYFWGCARYPKCHGTRNY